MSPPPAKLIPGPPVPPPSGRPEPPAPEPEETPEEARRRRAAAWGRGLPVMPRRGVVRIRESLPPGREHDTVPPETIRVKAR